MCNLCTLEHIKRDAKEEGLEVTIIPSNLMGGVEVFVHPKDIVIQDLPGWDIADSPAREQYWRAWLMEIPDYHTTNYPEG